MDIFYPIQLFSDWIVQDVFGMTEGVAISDALNFFIYDTVKIFILLIIITHLMSLVRYYLPVEKLREFLLRHKFFGLDYLLASLFGAITPFCSCSSIPLFIGFLEAGVPIGLAFTFLITSPLINEVAIALFLGMFGVKVTVIYILGGIIAGIIGGFILGKLKMDDQIIRLTNKNNINEEKSEKELSRKEIIKNISKEAFEIVEKISFYIILGVGVGAFIHGFVPVGWFEEWFMRIGLWAVPASVVVAVPIYANASGVIPIVQALVVKGVPLGVALSFMMAIVGLSLPEGIMLKKVLRWKLLLMFFGIVTLSIIILGYLFVSIF